VIGGPGAVPQGDGSPSSAANAQSGAALEARAAEAPSPAAMPGPAEDATPEPEFEQEDVRSSPLVRRMAREHNLDLRRIRGSGANGRISKEDVLAYMKAGGAAAAPTADKISAPPTSVTPAAAVTSGAAAEKLAPPQVALEGKLEPMSRM